MFDTCFIRHFVKACSVCYKAGAMDIAVSRDEADLLRLKEDTRYPNMYGTIKNSRQDWNEWRFTLLGLLNRKNEFTAELMALRSNTSVESIILRICQHFYNKGVEDYISCGMPMTVSAISGLTSMFELTETGYNRLTREKIVQKIQLFTYERMGMDREFIENYCGNDMEVGRKSHALCKKSYDKFSRMIWLTSKKKEWYEL